MSKYIIELNSDYIKSVVAFGMMGDKGVFTVFKIDELEELTSVKKTEYQRGFEDGKKAVNGKGCDGCKYEYENKRRVPCILCPNNFKLPCTISPSKLKSQWTVKDDKIEVGDEVEWEGERFVILRVFTPKGCYEQCDGFDYDGNGYTNILTKEVTKTGRHFDIQNILEAMKT